MFDLAEVRGIREGQLVYGLICCIILCETSNLLIVFNSHGNFGPIERFICASPTLSEGEGEMFYWNVVFLLNEKRLISKHSCVTFILAE